MYNLNRFLEAQETLYDVALSEIRQGRKDSHWIWFIFPQLKGLGSSEEAEYYGITNLDEAKAYLAHPILGQRLKESANAILDLLIEYIDELLPHPDDLKLRSSMTLFAQAAPEEEVFREVIRRFYGGEYDGLTLNGIRGQPLV